MLRSVEKLDEGAENVMWEGMADLSRTHTLLSFERSWNILVWNSKEFLQIVKNELFSSRKINKEPEILEIQSFQNLGIYDYVFWNYTS